LANPNKSLIFALRKVKKQQVLTNKTFNYYGTVLSSMYSEKELENGKTARENDVV
jgi:ureidoglycolate hydrolase